MKEIILYFLCLILGTIIGIKIGKPRNESIAGIIFVTMILVILLTIFLHLYE